MPDQSDDSPNAVNDDLRGRVRAWLEGTGFPLEFRVAEAAREHAPHWVDQSRYYTDPTTGKIRETDVVVQWVGQTRGAFANIAVVIECKSKPLPWVAFDSNVVDNDAYRRLEWSLYKATERHDQYGDRIDDGVPNLDTYADKEQTLFRMSRISTGIVSAMSGEGDRRAGATDPAWEAVQAAVSAAHGVGADLTVNRAGSFDIVRIAVFPVVVTSGRLFRAFLVSGSNLEVEEIERAEILVRLNSSPTFTRCFVVSEAGLPNFLAEAAATPKALLHTS